MTGKIPASIINKIKESNDIVDVVSQFCEPVSKGDQWWAKCPFPDHNEKTPSFKMSKDNQLYHCFGCKRGGDVVNFIKEIKGFNFIETIRFLGNLCGIDIDVYLNNRKTSLFDKIVETNSAITSYYSKNLFENKEVLSYLHEKRNIDDEFIKLFRLGYAKESWNDIVFEFGKTDSNKKILLAAGLAGNKNSRIYDFFRDRVIFPVTDVKGNIVGFSARSLRNDQMPKYINTRENETYRKRELLYGLNLAWNYIKEEDNVIITEGNIDVIKAYQAGVKNVVATCGTALTMNHIIKLKRYTNNFYIIFDPDKAGIKSAASSVEMFMKAGCNVKVVILPENLDMADYFEKYRSEDLLILKEKAPEVIDFKINNIISTCNNLKSYSDKINAIKKLEPFLNSLSDQLIYEDTIKRFSERLKCSIDYIKNNLKKKKQNRVYSIKKNIKFVKEPHKIDEKVFLGLLLKNNHLYKIIENEDIEVFFENKIFMRIYNEFCKESKNLNIISKMMENFSGEQEEILIRELLFSNDIPEEEPEEIFKSILKKIQLKQYDFFLQELQHNITLKKPNALIYFKEFHDVLVDVKKNNGDIKKVKIIFNKLKRLRG